MKAFVHEFATDAGAAAASVAGDPDAMFIAGGSNLVDHLKLGVSTPGRVVDVMRLPLAGAVEHDGGIRVGATMRNTDLATHPLVRERYEVLSRALLAGASAQIRNQATTAGNLLQRTRCVYFQDVSTPCNKRDPGSGCSAVDGYGRYNAILGASPYCVTVHPSDMAVGLSVLDATVLVLRGQDEVRIPFEQLHRLPGDAPERDTVLEHGDLITAVEIPALPADAHSTYAKTRDRASYAFALVSVAAVLHLDGDTVRDVRIGWGGVAHKPWRARRAEELLKGGPVTTARVREAVDAELADASTNEETAFKVPMLHGLTAMTLLRLAGDAS